MKHRKGLLSALILIACSLSVAAETYEAHVHGEASMEIHIEDHRVAVHIFLPGMDFVGFEHEPATESDRNAVHERIEAIEENPGFILKLRAGGFSKLDPAHAHAGEAGHEEHLDEEHHDEDHLDEEHREYIIELEFELSEGVKIKFLDLDGFFEQFPTVESLSWIRISDSGQSAGEATPRSDRIPLRD